MEINIKCIVQFDIAAFLVYSWAVYLVYPTHFWEREKIRERDIYICDRSIQLRYSDCIAKSDNVSDKTLFPGLKVSALKQACCTGCKRRPFPMQLLQ